MIPIRSRPAPSKAGRTLADDSAPDDSAPDSGRADMRRAWDALTQEIDRLNLSDPRAGLTSAERWFDGEPPGEGRARALRAVAYALRCSGAYERAVERFAEAERAFAVLGLPDEAARARIGHVEALRYLGRYDAAIRLARENLAYFESRGDALPLEAAKQTVNLGLVYWRLGDLRRALACFRRVRTVARRLKARELGATASSNLGLVLAELGRYGEALRADRYAAQHYRALGLHERLASTQSNLGILHLQRGEYARALQALEVSRALCDELGLDQRRVEVDLDLARTCLALNLDSEAAEACARAVATSRRLDLPFELAYALMRSGQTAERRGDLAVARAYIAEAEGVFDRIGNAVWRAVAAVQAIRLAAQAEGDEAVAGRLSAARAESARLETLGALDHAAVARLLVGDLEARRGRKHAAQESYQAAIAIGRRLRADDVLGLAHAARGVLVEDEAPDEALAAFCLAVEHLERLRAGARADDLKMSVVADTVDLYERIAALLLRRGSAVGAREAFQWVERGKSRGLLEAALSASERGSHRTTPAVRGAREQVKDLRARLNAAYSRRYAPTPLPTADRAPDADGIERLEAELARATRQFQILVRDDGVADVSALQAVERVQAALPAGACLLEYMLLGQELICFVVRRDAFSVQRGLATRDQIDEAAGWLRFHIRKGAYGAAFLRANQGTLAPSIGRALDRLGDLLLAPLAGVPETVEHVIIIPHGLLHTLPFHAFSHRGAALLDRAMVSYAPSAGMFVASVERRSRRPGRPLIVAPDLADLPWVADEAARIAKLFPDAVVLTGRRATLSALRRHARGCDALHLATHGVFRADNPSFSALELADGWLSVGELAELSEGRALITLSACHTGMTRVGPGDELLGLSRAVLGAGSASLVASLWAANDDTSPALMTAFYAGLQRGQSRAASLRQAALEIRASEPHPYFWAPFVLVGAP